eukprot:11424674-Karenia_brevis.AAC.1
MEWDSDPEAEAALREVQGEAWPAVQTAVPLQPAPPFPAEGQPQVSEPMMGDSDTEAEAALREIQGEVRPPAPVAQKVQTVVPLQPAAPPPATDQPPACAASASKGPGAAAFHQAASIAMN